MMQVATAAAGIAGTAFGTVMANKLTRTVVQPQAAEAPKESAGTDTTTTQSAPTGFAVPMELLPASSGFDMLFGLKDIKAALRRRFISTLSAPMNLPVPSAQHFLLLYGPPGTGKTSIARAIAGEIAVCLDNKEKHETGQTVLVEPSVVNFINFDPNAAFGKWVGESEKQVSAVFDTAMDLVEKDDKKMVIIFMDEAEALMLSRSQGGSFETANTVRTLVLMRMTRLSDFNDEQEAAGKSGRVIFIAATNYPNRLDDAFLRRFEKRVFIDLPDKESRKEQIRLGLLAPPFNVNLSSLELECLGNMTDLCSPSDIKQTLKTAQSLLPDLSLESSSYFRLNERGKYEIVPLIDPELPPCGSCPSPRTYAAPPCPNCKSVYKKVLSIEMNLLETTIFIPIADIIDLFATQRPSLNQETYNMIKTWHATRGTAV